MKENLDSILREITLCHGKDWDEQYYRKWLFEYAYQSLAYKGFTWEKQKDYGYWLMCYKAGEVRDDIVKAYNGAVTTSKGRKTLTLKLPPMSVIPRVVRQENEKR
jgi:hypothetical protein